MKSLTFDRLSYRAGGKPVFLYSGEFHYFRVPRPDWLRRMKLFRSAGGNCIATYVPWLVHEPEEGSIVFGGEAWRDFEGFLDTAGKVGLYVIVRPGPYQYSELINGGLPSWLLDKYPALLAKRLDGRPITHDAASYLHPLFLERARRWYEAVCPIIARHTISRGGAVAMTQFDNELMGIHLWRGSVDYNSETMGFGRPNGRYPVWLAGRYAEIDALNEAYDTAYASFDQVEPRDIHSPASAAEARRKKDYFEFYLSTIAEYSSTLVGWLRELGIDTPVVHNSGNWGMNTYFLETCEALDDQFLLGSDHYYNLNQDWRQNNPTPQWAINIYQSHETMRLMGYPPTVFEMPGGSLSDWPPITPHDILASGLVNVAFGMKGTNYYIFTGGPNPPGMGSTTDDYDYSAAICSDGRIGPLYKPEKRIGKFLQENSWLALAGQLSDFRIGFDFDQQRASNYGTAPDSVFASDKANHFFQTGVATTSFCAGLSPAAIDLSSEIWLSDTRTPVFVPAADAMSERIQRNIVKFLDVGGRLIVGPVLPSTDQALRPCTILADKAGASGFRAHSGRVRLTFENLANVNNTGTVFFADEPPTDAQILGIDEFTGRPIAWLRWYPSGGALIVLSFQWSHGKHEHSAMLLKLLGRLGLHQAVVGSNPNVWSTVRTDGKRAMLFAMNLTSSPMETS